MWYLWNLFFCYLITVIGFRMSSNAIRFLDVCGSVWRHANIHIMMEYCCFKSQIYNQVQYVRGYTDWLEYHLKCVQIRRRRVRNACIYFHTILLYGDRVRWPHLQRSAIVGSSCDVYGTTSSPSHTHTPTSVFGLPPPTPYPPSLTSPQLKAYTVWGL